MLQFDFQIHSLLISLPRHQIGCQLQKLVLKRNIQYLFSVKKERKKKQEGFDVTMSVTEIKTIENIVPKKSNDNTRTKIEIRLEHRNRKTILT